MCKRLVFLTSLFVLFSIGSLSDLAYAGAIEGTVQSATINTSWAANPQDITAVSEDGDWRIWDNVGAPAYEKNTSQELISDVEQIGSFSFATYTDHQNFTWTDGVDPVSTDSGGASIMTNTNIPDLAGFQFNVTLPRGAGNITVWAGTRACYGRLIILDGSTEVFSIDGGDRGTVWGLDRFDLEVSGFSRGTVLTIRWVSAPGETNGSGRLLFYGAAIGGTDVLPLAYNPYPANNKTDVLIGLNEISWTPNEYVALQSGTHNVFFGTNFDDVNNATIAEPLSTTPTEGLDVNNYKPGKLEYGTTYYWRVDEVNSPASQGQFKGMVWQFTMEPVALQLEKENITATASSTYETYDPNKTIDESGLDPNNMDLHSSNSQDMWLSSGEDVNDVWISYEFDKVYKLHQMMVWNYNFTFLPEAGLKDVNVAYSEDGQIWKEVNDVAPFAEATGEEGYHYITPVVDFNGAIAKFVKITAKSNYGAEQYGLSEVRFTYIPVWARETITPPDEATNQAVDGSTMLSWRAGRDADKHYLYIGTDVNSVEQNLVDPVILDEPNYVPDLALEQTYYWKVDEVNDNEEHPVWAGPTWSLSTVEYLVVDNFEVGYDDTDANAVWATWIDGYDIDDNGAQMGYDMPGPYLEATIRYSGGHSAPLYYDNSGNVTNSEVVASTSDLVIGSDWSKGSPEKLVFWFYGSSGNVADKLFVKLNDSNKVYYDGDLENLKRPLWSQCTIDLSDFSGVDLSNVQSVTIGLERGAETSTARSMILIDEIRLYRVAPPLPLELVWVEAETGSVTAPMMKFDDATASGGQYVSTEAGTGDAGSASPYPDGTLTLPFTVVEGGVYAIRFLVSTPGNDTSCWVQLPDATEGVNWAQYRNMPNSVAWHWAQQYGSYTLSAGEHNLLIAYRGSELRFDAILITKIRD